MRHSTRGRKPTLVEAVKSLHDYARGLRSGPFVTTDDDLADDLDAVLAEIDARQARSLSKEPPSMSAAAQDSLVSHLLLWHPLPWRLEFDWSVEVTDSNNVTVIKVSHVNEANEIIAFAKFLVEDSAATCAEFEQLLAGDGP